MKKIFISAALASVALSLAGTATAANVLSTEELTSYCKGSEAGALITCEIYGQAVYDTYLVTRHPKQAPNTICVKQPAPTRQEVIKEYVTWSEASPQYATMPAAESVLRFLSQKFPCGKGAK